MGVGGLARYKDPSAGRFKTPVESGERFALIQRNDREHCIDFVFSSWHVLLQQTNLMAVSSCFSISNDHRICQLFSKEGVDYANLLRESAELLGSESIEYVNVKKGNHTSNINNHY